MYIECKADGLEGPGRIGRVAFSKSGRSIRYREQEFQTLSGRGSKANYFEVATGEHYWISGPKKKGGDTLYGRGVIEIDEDVREEYWTSIREQHERKAEAVTK